jgi:hypothetical protein
MQRRNYQAMRARASICERGLAGVDRLCVDMMAEASASAFQEAKRYQASRLQRRLVQRDRGISGHAPAT